jgi:multicomponent K+:H+ antiporter subunit C
MEIVLAIFVGVLTGTGVWLTLRARTFDVILGLTLLSYAVNLFIAAMGRMYSAQAPIIEAGRAPSLLEYADPLPQALVLTAIVIGFAMTALLIVIALRSRAESGGDHVDGGEQGTPTDPAREDQR